eukprot:4149520-Pyramimonas_sp.AAC.1
MSDMPPRVPLFLGAETRLGVNPFSEYSREGLRGFDAILVFTISEIAGVRVATDDGVHCYRSKCPTDNA